MKTARCRPVTLHSCCSGRRLYFLYARSKLITRRVAMNGYNGHLPVDVLILRRENRSMSRECFGRWRAHYFTAEPPPICRWRKNKDKPSQSAGVRSNTFNWDILGLLLSVIDLKNVFTFFYSRHFLTFLTFLFIFRTFLKIKTLKICCLCKLIVRFLCCI